MHKPMKQTNIKTVVLVLLSLTGLLFGLSYFYSHNKFSKENIENKKNPANSTFFNNKKNNLKIHTSKFHGKANSEIKISILKTESSDDNIINLVAFITSKSPREKLNIKWDLPEGVQLSSGDIHDSFSIENKTKIEISILKDSLKSSDIIRVFANTIVDNVKFGKMAQWNLDHSQKTKFSSKKSRYFGKKIFY